MARSAQIAVPAGGQAVRVVASGADPDTSYTDTMMIQNTGTVIVELGGSDVASNNAYPLAAGEAIGVTVGPTGLFARVPGATAGVLAVLVTG